MLVLRLYGYETVFRDGFVRMLSFLLFVGSLLICLRGGIANNRRICRDRSGKLHFSVLKQLWKKECKKGRKGITERPNAIGDNKGDAGNVLRSNNLCMSLGLIRLWLKGFPSSMKRGCQRKFGTLPFFDFRVAPFHTFYSQQNKAMSISNKRRENSKRHGTLKKLGLLYVEDLASFSKAYETVR